MTKNFIAENETVYYINRECVDEVLGAVTVDVEDVFETAVEAAARI